MEPAARKMAAVACLMASIGGVSARIGTPPNIVLAGYLQKTNGYEITFANWLKVVFRAVMRPVTTQPNAMFLSQAVSQFRRW
ncbi:MAG: hypothetical protein WBB19_16695 [Desulforhopalus sp.]